MADWITKHVWSLPAGVSHLVVFFTYQMRGTTSILRLRPSVAAITYYVRTTLCDTGWEMEAGILLSAFPNPMMLTTIISVPLNANKCRGHHQIASAIFFWIPPDFCPPACQLPHFAAVVDHSSVPVIESLAVAT